MAAAAAAAAAAARPPDKDLVDNLIGKRRERLRKLRLEKRNDEYAIVTVDGDSTSDEKMHKQRTAHFLLRIFTLSFIVPLASTVEILSKEEGYGVEDVIVFAKSILLERPNALEHRFCSRSIDTSSVSPSSSSSPLQPFESTTFGPWLMPRVACACAMLLMRGESLVVQHLLDLAFTVVDLQLKKNEAGNVRIVMEELVRTSLQMLSSTGISTFLNTCPPPMHLAPRVQTDKIVFFGEGDAQRHLDNEFYRPPFGDGVSGSWMREDHTTYSPEGWEGIRSSNDRYQLAHALFYVSVTMAIRSADRHPAVLADIGTVAASLLISNWKCNLYTSRSPIRISLSRHIEEQRIRAAVYATISPVLSQQLMLLSEEQKTVDESSFPKRIICELNPTQGTGQDLRIILQNGLKAKARSKRLTAAREIAAIVDHHCGDDAQRGVSLELLFAMLRNTLKQHPKMCESTMLCLSLMGQVKGDGGMAHEVRGKVLYMLVMQLGNANVLLKSFAYTLIAQLATFHKCTTFQLLAPHLNVIAPEVVGKMLKAPSLFLEVLQLTKQSQSKFLQATLEYTLPRIIETNDDALLRLIAKGIGGELNVQSMCFNHAPAILKSLLMLSPAPRRDASILTFFYKVRGGEILAGDQDALAAQRSITLKHLLKGYSVELLGHLVIHLGDSSVGMSKRAFEGLQYMDSIINERQSGSRTAASRDEALKHFLHEEILAILSWLNEELMNAHGKKSMTHKAMVARSIGALIGLMGEMISSVTPQLMATLNTTMQERELMLPTLGSLAQFVTRLGSEHVGPFIGQMAATILASWPSFGKDEKDEANNILVHAIVDHFDQYASFVNDFPDLSAIQEDIPEVWRKLALLRPDQPGERVELILKRVANENFIVCSQALSELRALLLSERKFLEQATTGNAFDALVGLMIKNLFDAALRDDANIRDLSFENLAIIGAVDPDRLPPASAEQTRVMLKDFNDKEELTQFAVLLIKDVLIGAYKATNDTKHQSALAFAIQELLKFCGFTIAVLPATKRQAGIGGGGNVNLKTKQRWNSLASVVDTLAPLLQSKYVVQHVPTTSKPRPFYLHCTSFKEWIQAWTNALILDIRENDHAAPIFSVFRSVIRDHDLSIAQFILPHLVLNAVTLGTEEEQDFIYEEFVAVLQDQVSPDPMLTFGKLAAQVVFGLLDHLSVWQRVRQRDRGRGVENGKQQQQRNSKRDAVDKSVAPVERLMKRISQELMAKASLRCRAFARSLMNYEQQIRTASKESPEQLQGLYEDLHLIYANLDEPDGMEGISCFVLQPSLEHQIREHESTGRWTSAQSCWEVKIQDEPENLEFHIGLLRCLRNLGHYDTMRTHILGVLSNHSGWEDALSPFYIEGCCILSDWEAVRIHCKDTVASPQHAMAQVMLAMYDRDQKGLLAAIKEARWLLGKPVVASDYASAYDAITQLHMLHELGMISTANGLLSGDMEPSFLNSALSVRLESTLPSFRTREPLLSMRRSALSTQFPRAESMREIAGQCWIASSKIARREGHLQTAYSAALQATQARVPLAFVQHAKLRVATGDQGQAALQEMANSLVMAVQPPRSDAARLHSYANAHLFYARLSDASGRRHPNEIIELYKRCTELDPQSEKMWYHFGHYYDQMQERDTAVRMNLGNPLMQHYSTCKAFLRSTLQGTKYFYRTLPRVLTIWLTVGDEDALLSAMRTKKQDSKAEEYLHTFSKINELVRRAIDKLAPYQWLAVFPQLVSRVAHRNDNVWKTLQELISHVLTRYPDQAMWIMVAGLQSTDKQRKDRFLDIVNRVKAATKGHSTNKKIDLMIKIAKELLYLCDYTVKQDEKQLSMKAHFPQLLDLARKKEVVLPMQSSLSVTMPATGTADKEYKIFPPDLPKIVDLDNTIEVMNSLQRPRKIVISASDGEKRAFLCKPNDDLRKDARLMEFDGMINKLLQSNSESRKRRLYIRTYAVVTLNEECGLIEWVPNTVGLRHILHRLYSVRNIPLYSAHVKSDLDAARKDPKKAANIFQKVLKDYPPVFHEWFLTMFPEPSAWLAARLNYGHTLAVMSMVGYVLGLGDRHGENILFDSVSGDTVHVDLNCLFEKGATFEIPERVPFRLTQNLVDALGVTGVEGVFRRAAEIAMGVLREHKDSLMSVLEAMVHDPLVEWGIDDRAQQTHAKGRATATTATSTTRLDPRVAEARKSLDPVNRRLAGELRRTTGSGGGGTMESGHSILSSGWTSAHSTNGLVDALIRDATSSTLLSQMYVGWSAYL